MKGLKFFLAAALFEYFAGSEIPGHESPVTSWTASRPFFCGACGIKAVTFK